MKRALPWIILMGGATLAAAQTPDVFIHVDVVPTYKSQLGGGSSFRWYDLMGHHSIVGLSFGLEPGYRAWISERLEKIPHDRDSEQLDEYYIEDPGIWRVGKQYLPFGRQGILRESARAARGDTRLLVNRIPITIAIADNGNHKTRGVVGRIGSVVGVSFAFGNDFGTQATSLDVIRRPEEAPAGSHGYRTALGLDFSRHYKIYTLQAEAVTLRRGQTDEDPDRSITDLSLTLQPNRFEALTVGWSRDWLNEADFYRAQGRFLIAKSVWLEPIIRLRNGTLFDAGITLRVKL